MARSLVPYVFDAGFPTAHSFADPFLQLHREMNRVFDDALRGFGTPAVPGGAALGGPRLNVSESDGALHVEAELPGVSENDVHVELNDDVLTIRGEKKASREDKNMHVAERSFGSFSRSLRLPYPVSPEHVQASFEHGVLTVTLPKAAADQKVHRIQVHSGSLGATSTSAGSGASSSSGGARGGKLAEGMTRSAEPSTTHIEGGGGGTHQPMAEGMSKAGGKGGAAAEPGGNKGLAEKVARAAG